MKKPILIPEDSIQDKTKFCIECDTKLDNFCLSEDADNLDAVRKHHEQCKKIDRFKGDQCSRVFIAEPVGDIDLEEIND
jgi:hypothetical protein